MEDYNNILDTTPEGSTEPQASLKSTKGMTLRQKLETLNELLIDQCITNISTGKLKPNDLGAVVTLLKNNKVIEEKREHSESDLIDGSVQ